jgi:GPH family glycoside/pentoside/hexuronide:cation symporter
MLAGGGYNAASSQNSATISIIALFTIVPAICYLLSAIIAKRFYTLKTPFLVKMMAELAQGARRNEQDFRTVSEQRISTLRGRCYENQ